LEKNNLIEDMNDKRNWKISYSWIDGKDYDVIAQEFQLSKETIKKICMEKVPAKIRSKPGMIVNQYQRFRACMRRKRAGETTNSLLTSK
jgi:hypothetical protein